MRFTIVFLFFSLVAVVKAQLVVTEVGTLPEAVANNAVCEGFIGDTTFVFSFGGIDTSKIYSGIHLKSFRYNTVTGETLQLADLPDNQGKIASGASRIGDIIYIIGGYHVAANGSETTNLKTHRYDISNNTFLTDGADLPVGTDDHVQAVWRDSLLYTITGWNNTSNIPNVQIYTPETDSWQAGTAVPNNNEYKSFGASGVIVEDTIFYFGGASSGFGFPIQNQLRKGIINPNNPYDITWSIEIPDTNTVGYRMAATTVNDIPTWIGGSNNTYNFDGIAYDGSGGVAPNNRILYLSNGEWQDTIVASLPMDLRGVANASDSVKYIMGGMLDNQEVSNKIFKLDWGNYDTTSTAIVERNDFSFTIFPNPVKDIVTIQHPDNVVLVKLYTLQGQLIAVIPARKTETIFPTSELSESRYLLVLENEKGEQSSQVILK